MLLEILAKVGFDWRMAVMNLINFLVIFYILKKFLFVPISKKMTEREGVIREGIENATKAKSELQMAEQRARELIDAAKQESNSIIQASHEEAKMLAESMQQKARHEIEVIVAQAKKNIDIEKQEMRDELRKETVELVILAVEKILGERLDQKGDEKFIQNILKDIDQKK